jgi:hypothetical protein
MSFTEVLNFLGAPPDRIETVQKGRIWMARRVPTGPALRRRVTQVSIDVALRLEREGAARAVGWRGF